MPLHASLLISRNLTAFLQANPEYYEMEDDFHFHRWLHYVEPRTSPSGDLSLLQKGQEEILKSLPLDGRPLPPMRGNWEPLGPQAAGTAGAGRLNWIEFHPTDANTYMVGSPSGGLWITRDAGASWTELTANLRGRVPPGLYVSRVEASHHEAGTAYVAIDGHRTDDVRPHLLRTTDHGRTWTSISAVSAPGLCLRHWLRVLAKQRVLPKKKWARMLSMRASSIRNS